MKNIFIFILLLCLPCYVYAQRNLPGKPIVHSVTIEFNDEIIKGYFLLIDARTNEEKSQNMQKLALDGSVIVFLQGHAQRPDDAYKFTSQLAINSKSGIVVVPVCDTPYGTDPALRGDNGKMKILMELIRYALKYCNIDIANYSPDSIIKINGNQVPYDKNKILTTLTAVGWSHGALLARKISSKYGSIKNLVQICPAGYIDWSKYGCMSNCCVVSAFYWESLRISTGIFKGNGNDILSAGWGITKGITGDSCRSCSTCINSNYNIFVLFRGYKDLSDVTDYETGNNYPIHNVSSITVIFGEDDSLFNANKILNSKNSVNAEIMEKFFLTYYPEAGKNTKLHLFILPGNHLGPVLNYKDYDFHTLKYSDELKN